MTNPDDTLLYKKKHNITINDIQQSLYYYFDYDERSFDINMPFQHFHSFYEIMILISPQACHLVEGIPYSIRTGGLSSSAPIGSAPDGISERGSQQTACHRLFIPSGTLGNAGNL